MPSAEALSHYHSAEKSTHTASTSREIATAFIEIHR